MKFTWRFSAHYLSSLHGQNGLCTERTLKVASLHHVALPDLTKRFQAILKARSENGVPHTGILFEWCMLQKHINQSYELRLTSHH